MLKPLSRFVQVVFLTWFVPGLAAGQEFQSGSPLPNIPNTIVVSGTGEVHVHPDVAYVTFGVITEDKTAEGAVRANARNSERVLQAIRHSGIAQQDVQTTNYNLSPRYETVPNDGKVHTPRIDGYQMTVEVRTTVRNLEKIGAVIDSALGAGANSVNGVSFGLQDRGPSNSHALSLAVQDARRKAQAVAKAADLRIIGIRNVNELGASRPIPMFGANPELVRAAPPIAPGELTVTAEVSITFAVTPVH